MARERPASAAYWAAAASPALKATEIAVNVELTMATPTTVSSTTRTNTAAMAEPRSLHRCACRVPALRPEPAKPAWGFPRSRVPVSMNISVAAGPGEWDHERTCRRCGKGGGKVLHNRAVVLNGRGAGAAGILQGDTAVGEQKAAQRERDRVRTVLQIKAQVAAAGTLQVAIAVGVIRSREGVDDSCDGRAGASRGRT